MFALFGTETHAASPSELPPAPAREFRGAWVATVGNIDWPSKPGLSTDQQRTELIAILDRARQLNLNAIIFQVRPACDALYASKLEPWSEYLTGEMGKAPQPFYDPLAFAVEEAHRRGLELHAWFNPYRARHLSAKSAVSASHISKTRPQLVRQYGRYLWLDPAEKAVQDHSLAVIMDVVRRYDVDGIHMDDYFYPYKEKDAAGKLIDFPDDPSWKRYQAAGGKLSRDDWRRESVNHFIERVYRGIKAQKPWVKFGISPFGIWRPGHPPQIKGLDAYEHLYADSRKWLVSGWLDYFAPQLYWQIEPEAQSYPALMRWWQEQNLRQRHLWPGMNCAKVPGAWPPEEILNQIRLTRQQPTVTGNIHWNMKSLLPDRPLGDPLRSQLYQQPALVPASPWLSRKTPGKPVVQTTQTAGQVQVSWKPGSADPVRFWVVQTRRQGQWSTDILPGTRTGLHFAPTARERSPETVCIAALDRFGNMSMAALVNLPAPAGKPR